MPLDLFKEYQKIERELQDAISTLYFDNIREQNKIDAKLFQLSEKIHQKRLSGKTKIALRILGNQGWYLPSLDSPVTWHIDLSEEIGKGNIKLVDDELSKVIKENFKQLSKRIIEFAPNRKVILEDAFNAHKKKKYSLSVPVFLSQADGICKEKTNFELFQKSNDMPKTKNFVENYDSNSFLAGLLEPLNLVLPIAYSANQRKEDINFNRHQILHGEILNYNTFINSCKAFSLLSYVCTVLKIAKN